MSKEGVKELDSLSDSSTADKFPNLDILWVAGYQLVHQLHITSGERDCLWILLLIDPGVLLVVVEHVPITVGYQPTMTQTRQRLHHY
jgi:hypothetical protein